jgi:hypothetical protein
MRLKVIVGLALVLSGGLAAFPTSAADADSLLVVVIPSQTHVRLREPFGLALRVENPTQTNQTIRVMDCAWRDEWQSNNPKIPWGPAMCSKNFPVDVAIPPGGAYTNEAPMEIDELIPDRELSFRMGFTSIGSAKVLWSNEVKLHMLPPDTWQHGGKYYRDRNHDGKIDWEVSGATWGGQPVRIHPFTYVTNSDGSVRAVGKVTGQGVDTYKVDTNYDGFYDLEYGAGGTNGQVQWTKNIHERVPVVGKDFIPAGKESWMDYWMPK